jgi:hypothetical protein
MIGGCVITPDCLTVDGEYELTEEFGSPFLRASRLAINVLMDWRQRCAPADEITIVLDQGIDEFNRLDDRIQEIYGFRLVPASVKQTTPLQAADLAAWEIHRMINDLSLRRVTDRSKLRGSYQALADRFPRKCWFVLDEQALRLKCTTLRIPRR